jgi:nicotinate-nucleotide adenylyltransferase
MKPDNSAGAAPIGIMGGAFDPVHLGHLRTAIELQELLQLDQVRFIPSANPPHRAPHYASAEQRVAMLVAALHGHPGCVVDEREINRGGPSWSVVTLEELRAEYPGRSLCMIIGMDAFHGLPEWHRWQELLELAHILIACRPGSALPARGAAGELLARRGVNSPAELTGSPAGAILVHEVTQLEISSSQIRNLVAAGRSIEFLVPPTVAASIAASGCYVAGNEFEQKEHGAHG